MLAGRVLFLCWGGEPVPEMRDVNSAQDLPKWVREAFHDLCQPLTALQCQLYLALLEVDDSPHQEAKVQREMFEAGLDECKRMIHLIRAAQSKMAAADEARV